MGRANPVLHNGPHWTFLLLRSVASGIELLTLYLRPVPGVTRNGGWNSGPRQWPGLLEQLMDGCELMGVIGSSNFCWCSCSHAAP